MLGDASTAVAAIAVAFITAIGGIVQSIILVKLSRIGKTVNGAAERGEHVTRVLRKRVVDLGGDPLVEPEEIIP